MALWLPPQSVLALRERVPELLVPNRPPIGRVEINWSNSLWNGLALCWVATQPVNLVDNQRPTINGTELVGSDNGATARFTKTDTGSIYWNQEYLKTSNGLGTGDFSIVARANPVAESVLSAIAGQKWDPGGSPFNQVVLGANMAENFTNNQGRLGFVMYTVGTGAVGIQLVDVIDGNWHTFFGVRQDTNFHIGINYRAFTTKTSQDVADISDGKRYTLIGNGGKNSSSDAYGRNQAFVLMFNRALTESEAHRIHYILTSDLRQLLKPANDDPYLISAGAATAPGVPTSLINQNITASGFRSVWTAPA